MGSKPPERIPALLINCDTIHIISTHPPSPLGSQVDTHDVDTLPRIPLKDLLDLCDTPLLIPSARVRPPRPRPQRTVTESASPTSICTHSTLPSFFSTSAMSSSAAEGLRAAQMTKLLGEQARSWVANSRPRPRLQPVMRVMTGVLLCELDMMRYVEEGERRPSSFRSFVLSPVSLPSSPPFVSLVQ